ncbi:MAG TPA: hypothetical protein DCY79_00820 [Planctomycetaceae bacterium]|nr:hypothetical protein [Blastopirellula sp.]HAY78328.1 hypothetical protein [Planctomycetaceae bacterium]|tara:strand:+ start:141 stop:1118 length:978 start_codon:yes stop_codon:yes gene_type:complete
MRQVGSLPSEAEAKRFTAFLITQQISAQAEQTPSGAWVVWSRDENDLQQAKQELAKFQENPNDTRYQGVEQQAQTLQKEAAERQQQLQKNVVQVRKDWGRTAGAGPNRKRPITLTLMGVAIVASFAGNFGNTPNGMIYSRLRFVEADTPQERVLAVGDPLRSIQQGQIWRLVTPIFLHGDPIHLVFNMLWMYQLGGILEWLLGPRKLLGLVLATAIFSNLAQALTPPGIGIPFNWNGEPTLLLDIGGSPFFVGMSGVVYALFGYVLVKSKFDPGCGLVLRQSTVIIMLAWLVLCMTPLISGIANMGHLSGLVVGAAIAYLPLLRR